MNTLNETEATCCSCSKRFQTVSEHIANNHGWVYCTQCRAEKGYIDGLSELPWHNRKRVWIVEGIEAFGRNFTSSWIEGAFSSEAAAKAYLTQKLHTHPVQTDTGEAYIMEEDEDWLSSVEPVRYQIRCEEIHE